MNRGIASMFLLLLAACASTSGIVTTGPDTYMVVGDAGQFGSNSSDTVSVELFREARAYCVEQKKELKALKTTGRDGNFGRRATSKLEFQCVEKGNAAVGQPTK